MSLADALQAEKMTYKGPRCSTCQIIEKLDEKDVTALLAAFNDPIFTSAAITRALRSMGHNVSGPAVVRHRRGECQK